MEFEKEKIQAMTELKLNDPKGLKIVEDTEKKLQAQIDKLKKIRAKKGCASDEAKLKQASDFEVYKRADEGTLNSARVIARAREGKLVDGSGATCEELDSIIFVDQKAIKFEKDKLEAMGGGDAAEKKAVADAEKAIEAQVKKLEGLMKTKKCKIAS